LASPLASALASASLGLAALAPSSLASSLAPPSLVRWLGRVETPWRGRGPRSDPCFSGLVRTAIRARRTARRTASRPGA
jgi:hypothetical protein